MLEDNSNWLGQTKRKGEELKEQKNNENQSLGWEDSREGERAEEVQTETKD